MKTNRLNWTWIAVVALLAVLTLGTVGRGQSTDGTASTNVVTSSTTIVPLSYTVTYNPDAVDRVPVAVTAVLRVVTTTGEIGTTNFVNFDMTGHCASNFPSLWRLQTNGPAAIMAAWRAR